VGTLRFAYPNGFSTQFSNSQSDFSHICRKRAVILFA